MIWAPAAAASRAPCGDPARVAADQLDDHQRQALAHRGAAHDVGPAPGEFGAGDHLGRHIGRAQPAAARRNGRSETPVIGAIQTRPPTVTPPIVRSLLILYHPHAACFLGKLCSAVKRLRHFPLKRGAG